MMIVAPEQVVRGWRNAAERTLAAAGRAVDPHIVEGLLRDAPREVRELVAYLTDALAHAGGVLLASALNASPAAAEVFAEGLERLADEVVQALAGEHGAVCPLPKQDGTPLPCGCGPDERAVCEVLAGEVGAGELPLGGPS
jgi:hypothetical protein